jgi:phospholipid/cholesterol/gamma-HCH transport system permease protein
LKKEQVDRQLAIARITDDTVVVRLSGPFRMGEGLVSTDSLERALEEEPPPRQVGFDAAALTAWDSTLVAFLAGVVTSCRRRGVTVDISGLPPGARRLLGLVESAPAAPARATPGRPSWIARLGLRALGSARRNGQLVELVGRTTLSFGAFAWAAPNAGARTSFAR